MLHAVTDSSVSGPVSGQENPPQFRRVLLKISGEALMGDQNYGIDMPMADRIASEVASGMAYLHSLNIVHRDLNSNNVLIDKKGNAKVCDFGLAQVRKTQTARTSKGRGTTSYTAPEVIKCSPWNERADVFSFGVLLWELTHLTRPWEGFADYQVMYQVAERGARLPFAEGLDAGLQHLIETCWAEDPAQRPPFDQLLTALHELPPDAMPMKTSGNDKY